MKKNAVRLVSAALALIFLLTFSGCGFLAGDPIEYSNGTGLTVEMPKGMEPFSAEGFAMAYAADDIMMSAVKESFDDYAELELDLAAMSLEEYARLTREINGLEQDFSVDGAGNLFVTYSANIDGRDYFYYSTLRKGTDAFWVVTFACPEKNSDKYCEAFEGWSASIEVD